MKIDTIDFAQTSMYCGAYDAFPKNIMKKAIPVIEALSEVAEPKYRVLVVDDDHIMQKIMFLELEQLTPAIEIDWVASGEEAVVITTQKTYDFIFLDTIMPGISGLEACVKMRSQPKMKKTPIIMISANGSPIDEAKAIIAGCTTYLRKPIVHDDFQKLLFRISKWVDAHKAGQHLMNASLNH